MKVTQRATFRRARSRKPLKWPSRWLRSMEEEEDVEMLLDLDVMLVEHIVRQPRDHGAGDGISDGPVGLLAQLLDGSVDVNHVLRPQVECELEGEGEERCDRRQEPREQADDPPNTLGLRLVADVERAARRHVRRNHRRESRRVVWLGAATHRLDEAGGIDDGEREGAREGADGLGDEVGRRREATPSSLSP